MGFGFAVGPAVNITKLLETRPEFSDSELETDVLFAAGLPNDDFYDKVANNEDFPLSYRDAILFDFVDEFLPEQSGLPDCIFHYHRRPSTEEWYIYADAEEMFTNEIETSAAVNALRQVFGGAEVEWLEDVGW